MNYLDEFQRLSNDLELKRSEFEELHKEHFETVLSSLNQLVRMMETDPVNFRQIDRVNVGISAILNDYRPFAETELGRELLIIHNSYTEFIISKLDDTDQDT
jgi:hypothetical protein